VSPLLAPQQGMRGVVLTLVPELESAFLGLILLIRIILMIRVANCQLQLAGVAGRVNRISRP